MSSNSTNMFNSNLPSMITARDGCAAAAQGNQIFVMGGANDEDEYLETVEMFDISTQEWSAIEPMSTERCHAAAVSFNGNIVIMGGFNDNHDTLSSAEQYSPITKQWSSFPSMTTPRFQSAAAVVDGKIIVVGGFNMNGDLASAEEYDPKTGSWREISPMNVKRCDCAAAALDGKLYVFGGMLYSIGGYDGVNPSSSAEVYDPKRKKWTLIENVITPRHGCAAAALGGRIIVVGGYNKSSGENDSSLCESYNPTTKQCSSIAPMRSERCHCVAVEVQGTIFVIGGNENGFSSMKCLPSSKFFAFLIDADEPDLVKDLNVVDSVMPSFLSFVDQNCRLLTLWKLVRNRQDVLSDGKLVVSTYDTPPQKKARLQRKST